MRFKLEQEDTVFRLQDLCPIAIVASGCCRIAGTVNARDGRSPEISLKGGAGLLQISELATLENYPRTGYMVHCIRDSRGMF
jgi:hypothetical protein